MRDFNTSPSRIVAPALKALLNGFLDYAGIFPPAKLPLEDVCTNFNNYRAGEQNWMLHWLVLNAEQAQKAPKSIDGFVSLVADNDDARACSLETKTIIQVGKPVYCELLPGNAAQLDAIKASGCFAKIRTGGLTPDTIPTTQAVATFIQDCAVRKLAFKATAGLHHPIRGSHPLTYENDAPHAVMHGFINVLLAACFAWHGEKEIESIVSDMNASNFIFDDRASWQSKSLTVVEIEEARKNFIHSVGSCSFDEPVRELQALNLL